ncbi:MAG: T9SS type A sorting domain-containing protein [Paludibacter sp.]
MRTKLIALCLLGLWLNSYGGQIQYVGPLAVAAAGATITGSGGEASFTVGQVCYTTVSALTGLAIQGVQQSYNTPILTTTGSLAVTTNSATANASIVSNGGDPIITSGFCWSSSAQNPTIANDHIANGAKSGTFSSSLSGLSSGTTYYVRAYATNAMGTTYGNRITLTPLALGTLAGMNKTYGDATFALTKPTSGSLGAFTYGSSNTNVATVSGNIVTIVGAGEATITATQAASGVYGSVATTALLTVDKANQVLTLSPLPSQQPLNTFSNIQLTASSSASLSPVISLGSGSAATLNGSNQLESIGSTGTVTVILTQAGNTNYNSASLSQSFDVVKSNQEITFGSVATSYFGAADFALSGAANSSLAVTYTSSNTDVATISGSTVTIVGVGSTNITASQVGNGVYNPAPTVVQTYTVNASGATVNATTALSGITATTATSGGTVSSIGSSAVTARGVCWSTDIHPTASLATRTLDANGIGDFSSSLTNLTSGTTYYVKAYATNTTGTTYGPELSFMTSIVVNTTKNSTELPTCATCDVTVESTGTLNVTNTVVAQDLTLKADNSHSFSASVGTGMTVNGTLRYVKTMDKGKWYFISFPCDVPLSDIVNATTGASLGSLGTAWYVNYYDGASRIVNQGTVSNWKDLTDSKLIANKGYIIAIDGTGTMDVAFKLPKSIIESETQKSISVVAYGISANVGANNKGWNLVGQPYLSRYAGGSASVNYMLFPTASNNGQTYDVAYKADGGRVIDPFISYFVQAGDNSDIPFDLGGRQSAPASVKVNEYDRAIITLTTATGTDNTNLIMDDAQSADYQIGQDMEKWIGIGTAKPQIYTQLGSINYAFNSLPASSVVNLPLGVYSKGGGTSTISTDASMSPGITNIYLIDRVAGVTTDLKASTYTFVATAGTTTTRFAITVKRVPTENVVATENGGPTLLITPIAIGVKLIINNLVGSTVVRVYDAIGRMFVSKTTGNESIEIVVPVTGVYTIQLQSGNKSWVRKVVAP